MYTERDRLGQIDYAWNEGKAEGLLEGEARGLIQGELREKQRILELINQGYTIEQLASLLCEANKVYQSKINLKSWHNGQK